MAIKGITNSNLASRKAEIVKFIKIRNKKSKVSRNWSMEDLMVERKRIINEKIQ